MGETFTKTFNPVTGELQSEYTIARENLDADDLIFYNSLRPELDLLKKRPKLQTIHNILDYSKGSR